MENEIMSHFTSHHFNQTTDNLRSTRQTFEHHFEQYQHTDDADTSFDRMQWFRNQQCIMLC